MDDDKVRRPGNRCLRRYLLFYGLEHINIIDNQSLDQALEKLDSQRTSSAKDLCAATLDEDGKGALEDDGVEAVQLGAARGVAGREFVEG